MIQRPQLLRTVEWFGYAIGLALLLWGVANAAILVATGGSWQGPLSLRKPAAFGVSFGLTLVTIVWVASWMQLKDRSRNLILGVFAFLCVAETALISLQAWRGVPSHFNEATPFDAGVTRLLAGFGAALVVTIAILTLASFRANQGTAPAMRIAIRTGFVMLMGSMVTGGLMIANGVQLVRAGDAAAAYATAGSLKPIHAVLMHGILALPVLAWLASRVNWSESRQKAVVLAASAAYALVAAVVVLATLR